MACVHSLLRREGRYYLQVRLSPPVVLLLGRHPNKVSSRTGDHRQARVRLAECMA